MFRKLSYTLVSLLIGFISFGCQASKEGIDFKQITGWQQVQDNLYIGQGITKLKDDKLLLTVVTSKESTKFTPTNLSCSIVSVKYSAKTDSDFSYVTVYTANKMIKQSKMNFSTTIIDKKQIPKGRKVIIQCIWKGYQNTEIDQSVIMK